MRKTLSWFFFFLYFILVNTTSFGQKDTETQGSYDEFSVPVTEEESEKNKKDSLSIKDRLNNINTIMEKVVKYSPLPILSYSTETDWMFGLSKYNAFRMGSKDTIDESIQPSQITSLAYFTLNHQYKIGTEVNLMFNKNKYKSHTEIYYLDYPEYYYGTGNETLFEDERLVRLQNLLIYAGFEYNFNSSLYVGLYYNYDNYYTVDYLDSLDIGNNESLTENEGLQSGLGINFARETRDNRFNASKGSYLFIKYMNYGKWLGSKFDYNLFLIDARKYFTPWRSLTIAMQVYTEARFGNVPVQSLALMGGDDRMRGIFLGRYRDHTIIDGQVEIRFPIAWIFGGTVFGSLGQVAPDYQSYTLDGFHWAGGIGLRIMVDSQHKTNLRFDAGFSKDHEFNYRQLYFFTFAEAF
jgi:hypothetical protein